MKRAALLLALLSFSGVSCERHSWEETKKLHHHGGGAHADEPAGHGEATAHGEASAHGEAAAHGESDAPAEAHH